MAVSLVLAVAACALANRLLIRRDFTDVAYDGFGRAVLARAVLPLAALFAGSAAIGSAIYQLDVNPDGRYVADGDGPQEVNGFFQVHTSTGDAPNPLWQFDGSIDLLTAISPR